MNSHPSRFPSISFIRGSILTVTLAFSATGAATTPGQIDPAFHSRLHDGTFRDIEFLADGRVVVLGNFATLSGGPNAALARLLPDGSVDPTFRFDTTGLLEFIALAQQADGKLLLCARNTQAYVVRRLLADGSIDPAFGDVSAPDCWDVQVAPDGGILVIGQRGLRRFHPEGRIDEGFNQRANLNSWADNLAFAPDGVIYLSGAFTQVGTTFRPALARLFPDGTPAPDFQPDVSRLTEHPAIRALPDGLLTFDSAGIHRLDTRGNLVPYEGGNNTFTVSDSNGFGGLVGVLANTNNGAAVQLGPDGRRTTVDGTFTVPPAAEGYQYSFLRRAPDGALWLAQTSIGGVEATNTLLRLYGPDPYAAWAESFALGGMDAAPQADPDQDGVANLSEFFYGSSPLDAHSQPAFSPTLTPDGAASLPVATFHRRRSLGSVKFSATASASPTFDTESPAEIVSVTPENDAFERVVVRGPKPPGPTGTQFLRFVLRKDP